MAKYRKKPVIVEAFLLNERGLVSEDWFWDAVSRNDIITHSFGEHEPDPAWCEIMTLEGVMVAKTGDYIIRGVNGEIYPCKADIFNKTYDELDMCEKECASETAFETVKRLRAEVDKLEADHNHFVVKWADKLKYLEQENHHLCQLNRILEAQMEVVRLIFGKGGCNG